MIKKQLVQKNCQGLIIGEKKSELYLNLAFANELSSAID